MPYTDNRWPQNFQYGTLTAAISVSDTTINSAELATLATLTSGTRYIPIVLLIPATRTYEIAWVTLHNAGATTATIVRGKEGSTAQAWPSGSQWICAANAWDLLQVLSTTTLPSDYYAGMRATIVDRNEIWEATYNQGWQGTVRAIGADIGRAMDGSVTGAPNGYAPIFKPWSISGSTDANGVLNSTIPNAGFPTRLISAQVTRVVNGAAGTFYVPCVDLAASSKTIVSVRCVNAAGANLASTAVVLSLMASGY